MYSFLLSLEEFKKIYRLSFNINNNNNLICSEHIYRGNLESEAWRKTYSMLINVGFSMHTCKDISTCELIFVLYVRAVYYRSLI